MKNTLTALITLLGINLLGITNALALPAKFIGTDYSGVYSCKGTNEIVGNYEVTVTFSLNKSNSSGNVGNYDLSVKTENATVYTGQAIVKGNDMALTIKFVEGNKLTYSTGLAKFKRIYIEDRHYSYINEYYESERSSTNAKQENKSSGNFGAEECIQMPSTPNT